MSNRPPKINPTGTKYSRIPVYFVPKGRFTAELLTEHSKRFKRVLDIVGEYIKADYDVSVRTYVEAGRTYADVTCKPPLAQASDWPMCGVAP